VKASLQDHLPNTFRYYDTLTGKMLSPIFTIHQRSNLTNTFSRSDTTKKQENPTRRKDR
jgi:hypothetical protein